MNDKPGIFTKEELEKALHNLLVFAGHPLWSFAITIGAWGLVKVHDPWLPFVGLAFGCVHEGVQLIFKWPHGEEWSNWRSWGRDVLDFTIGGLAAWLCIFWGTRG